MSVFPFDLSRFLIVHLNFPPSICFDVFVMSELVGFNNHATSSTSLGQFLIKVIRLKLLPSQSFWSTAIARNRNFRAEKHIVIDAHTWIDIKSLETICGDVLVFQGLPALLCFHK